MRTVFIRPIFLLALVFAASEARSFCLFSCEPDEANGRQVLENVLKSMFETPFKISNFTKTNATKNNMMGYEVYQLQYTADLDFPRGIVSAPSDFWAEMRKAAEGNTKLSELRAMMSWTVKSIGDKFWEPAALAVRGSLSFRKTNKGWEGQDGKVY